MIPGGSGAAAETAAAEEENAMPVPQVKVGPDGSIIVDEATTVIDTTQARWVHFEFGANFEMF